MFRFEPITEEKLDKISDFILANFFAKEPLGLAMGVRLDEVKDWFPFYLSSLLLHYPLTLSVSRIAVEEETGEVAGVVINVLLGPGMPPLPKMRDHLEILKHPAVIQVADLLEQLEQGVDESISALLAQRNSSSERSSSADNDEEEDPSSWSFKSLFLSVSSKWGGRGLGYTLVELGVEAGRGLMGRKLKFAVSDVTSLFSYKIFAKLGFKEIKGIEYSEYRDVKGDKPLCGKELGPHTRASYVAKLLL